MARVTANRTPASASAGQGQRAVTPGGLTPAPALPASFAGAPHPIENPTHADAVQQYTYYSTDPRTPATAVRRAVNRGDTTSTWDVRLYSDLINYMKEYEGYVASHNNAAKPRISRGKPVQPKVASTGENNRRRGGPETILTQGLTFADQQPRRQARTLLGE
ncbi:hypothetical protein FACS189460_4780 [Deltaproteobacteria bacterium]|nr:hypothetical protein FACS189460_4780 [Deltaproteobacteria bacterium]